MNKAGIYLHIPFCKTKCIYCDFYSVINKDERISDFVECMINEIRLNKKTLYDVEYNTIFFGGGTPSVLEENQLDRIMNELHSNFNIADNAEISLECNPGEINFEKLKNFRSIGINRLSIGFQTLNDNLLKFLGRLHNTKQSLETYDNAIKAGYENINIDLIYDIPNQKIKDWKKELVQICTLSPNHISAYSLTVENNTKLNAMVKNKTIHMPSTKIDRKMFLTTSEILTEANYGHYEISNFSKKNKNCKHNLHYWNLDPYIALGPGAHGFDGKKRWWNKKSIEFYMNSIKQNKKPIQEQEILSNQDQFNELIMNGLRLVDGFELSKISLMTQDEFLKYLKPHEQKWPYFKIRNERIKLKYDGLLFADEIISDLFLI